MNLFYSALNPQLLAQCLGQSHHAINVYWFNEGLQRGLGEGGKGGRSFLKGKGHWDSDHGARALTFTEWLWKSVTTISFLLFTATKWGPGNRKRVLMN